MENKRLVGELEIAILNIIRTEKRASVHDVLHALKPKRKYTTIMTVMQRLFEKGELCREKIGRYYEYWIEETNKTNLGLMKRLKKKIFGDRSIEMVSYLIEMDDDITLKELDELESLIEKRRAKEKQ